MKNFARIIDLGTCECCVYRQEVKILMFVFWMRKGNHVLSPSISKQYPNGWVLDQLFVGHEHFLQDEAQKVLDMVLHQIDLHDEQLQDGVLLSLEGNMLDKLFKAPKQSVGE